MKNIRGIILYIVVLLYIICILLFGYPDDENKTGLLVALIFVIAYGVYYIISRVHRDMIRYKINNLSFEQNKSYFRDIIKKYSIAELSFIDGFEFSYFNDIVAMLLKLERLNALKIDGEKIIALDYSNLKLTKSEKYLLSSIKDGYLDELDEPALERIVEAECIEDGLIETISNQEKNLYFADIFKNMRKVTVPMFFVMIGCFVAIFTLRLSDQVKVGLLYIAFIIIVLLIIVFPIVILVKVSISSGEKLVKFKLLDDGKNIYFKLQGLKNYIKDFSSLDNKAKEEIQLWDDFLIYSVMFGLNKQIPDKYLKILKRKPDIALSENSDKGIYFRD